MGYLQCKKMENPLVLHLLIIDPARLPLPLHFSLVEDTSSLPTRQQRLGVPKVWSLRSTYLRALRYTILDLRALELFCITSFARVARVRDGILAFGESSFEHRRFSDHRLHLFSKHIWCNTIKIQNKLVSFSFAVCPNSCKLPTYAMP